MIILVMGCGRVGALVAKTLAADGHQVTIIDSNEENLRRLPTSSGITTMLGDAALEDDLKRAGVQEADAFLALEGRDARNILVAQKVRLMFNVPKIVCHIADPVRQEMYRDLDMGIEAISPTKTISAMLLGALKR
jgi:trk system potassium uptake protein TrkA